MNRVIRKCGGEWTATEMSRWFDTMVLQRFGGMAVAAIYIFPGTGGTESEAV